MPSALFAQLENLSIKCPFTELIFIKKDTTKFHYEERGDGLIMVSKTDSFVLSGVDGVVTNIEREEDGKYGFVLYKKVNKTDYYLWYSGLHKLFVKKNDKIRSGQQLGIIKPGDELTLMLFDDATPIDSKKFLACNTSEK